LIILRFKKKQHFLNAITFDACYQHLRQHQFVPLKAVDKGLDIIETISEI